MGTDGLRMAAADSLVPIAYTTDDSHEDCPDANSWMQFWNMMSAARLVNSLLEQSYYSRY